MEGREMGQLVTLLVETYEEAHTLSAVVMTILIGAATALE